MNKNQKKKNQNEISEMLIIELWEIERAILKLKI